MKRQTDRLEHFVDFEYEGIAIIDATCLTRFNADLCSFIGAQCFACEFELVYDPTTVGEIFNRTDH